MRDLTDEERKAIAALKRLAKRWPKSLWLYSASGTLWVMSMGEDGKPARDGEGVHQDYVITHIGITNDGGDW